MRGRGRGEKAFTLVEIMIVVAIIATLAALSIPSMLRARMQANEGTAVTSCKLIAGSCQTYYNQVSPHTYPSTLSGLTSPTSDPPYIDSSLAGATSAAAARQGYYYTYVLVDAEHFTLNATPASLGRTGSRYFFVDETAIIRANPSQAAGPSDPPVQ